MGGKTSLRHHHNCHTVSRFASRHEGNPLAHSSHSHPTWPLATLLKTVSPPKNSCLFCQVQDAAAARSCRGSSRVDGPPAAVKSRRCHSEHILSHLLGVTSQSLWQSEGLGCPQPTNPVSYSPRSENLRHFINAHLHMACFFLPKQMLKLVLLLLLNLEAGNWSSGVQSLPIS